MAIGLNLSPRGKRIAKWVGYPLLAITSFLLAIQATFPYDRVVKKFVIDGLAAKYEVNVGSVDRGILPFSVTLKKLSLTTRKKKADDKQSTIFVNAVTVKVGLMTALRMATGTMGADFEAKLGGGTLSGSFAQTKTNVHADATLDGIEADAVPGLADAVGLPVGGKIEGSATFDLPGGDWRQAELKLVLTCKKNCTIGDGVAKIYPKPRPGQPQLDGVTVARLFLSSWTLELDVSKGKGTLKQFDLKSDDGELYVDLHIEVQRSLMESPITAGCIKFKGSEVLRKREEKFYNALTLTGAPLGPDGYHYVTLTGTLGNIMKRPLLCSLDGGAAPPTPGMGGVDATGHTQIRPTIRTPPPEAPRPTGPLGTNPIPTSGLSPPPTAPPPNPGAPPTPEQQENAGAVPPPPPPNGETIRMQPPQPMQPVGEGSAGGAAGAGGMPPPPPPGAPPPPGEGGGAGGAGSGVGSGTATVPNPP